MSQENGLTPAQRELEAALGGLQPAAMQIERDRFLYQAGRASATRRNRAWPVLTAALSVMLGLSLLHRGEPEIQTVPVERIVYVQSPGHAPAAVFPAAGWTPAADPDLLQAQAYYVQLRDRVLTEGLDALPLRPERLDRPGQTDLPTAGQRGRQDYLPLRQSLLQRRILLLNGDSL
ncbi:MAG: hypothetical protein JW810_14725 [Sedimentisphaerales bacterium]|nr:hypothetical protein [Sedimentisphaerales bacterium]